jgi:hypothetical protein
MIRAMTRLVHCFLLGEDRFLVLSWWSLVRCYKEQITVAGLLFFVIIFLFLVVCIHIIIRGLPCCRGCTFVILMYSLCNKNRYKTYMSWSQGLLVGSTNT